MNTQKESNRVLVVIPTLNEAEHISQILDQVTAFALRQHARGGTAKVIVVDGGSTDGTRSLVQSHEGFSGKQVDLLHNPARIQSAGINLAVSAHPGQFDTLIRIDAHASYPDDFCDVLLEEAYAQNADAVVVAMRASGCELVQSAIALAQNSRIGNGGANHRTGTGGKFVDHGHHALMRLDAFLRVGGYDATFSHNEDAELDYCLGKAGYRIWQTNRVVVDYRPRRTLQALSRQYVNFGAGRAKTIAKHSIKPRLRQMAVAALAPALSLALLAPLWLGFLVPLMVWVAVCTGAGIAFIIRGEGVLRGLLAGLAAGLMHLSWSLGFWSFHFRKPFTKREVPA